MMIGLAIVFGLGVAATIQMRKFGLRFSFYRKIVQHQLKEAELDEIYANREYADPRRQPKPRLPRAIVEKK